MDVAPETKINIHQFETKGENSAVFIAKSLDKGRHDCKSYFILVAGRGGFGTRSVEGCLIIITRCTLIPLVKG